MTKLQLQSRTTHRAAPENMCPPASWGRADFIGAGGGGGAILGVLAAVAGIGAVGGYYWYVARSHRRDRTYEIELSLDNSSDKPLSTAEQAKLKRGKRRRLAMMLYGSRARVMWQP